jgi:RimJ/RimL family protein N-acetyltransferase
MESAESSVTEFRLMEFTPEKMQRMWKEFKRRSHQYPNGLALDVTRFVGLMTEENTEVYEVGDFAGVVYFTGVVGKDEAELEEPRASSHILIWDKGYYGRADLVRRVVRYAMSKHGLSRVVSEIPAFNRMAIKMAERVGFQHVGVLRRRYKVADAWENSVVMDALASDLKKAKQDGRHRRSRAEVVS